MTREIYPKVVVTQVTITTIDVETGAKNTGTLTPEETGGFLDGVDDQLNQED